MTSAYSTVAVLGAGAWGTALAQVAAAAGRKVMIWAREPEVVDSINGGRENTLYLPGIPLNGAVHATSSLKAVANAELILAAPPAQHMRAMLKALKPHLPTGTPIVLCAKVIERGTSALMTEVIAEELTTTACDVLSGTGLAKDVARGLPTAPTVATPF